MTFKGQQNRFYLLDLNNHNLPGLKNLKGCEYPRSAPPGTSDHIRVGCPYRGGRLSSGNSSIPWWDWWASGTRQGVQTWFQGEETKCPQTGLFEVTRGTTGTPRSALWENPALGEQKFGGHFPPTSGGSPSSTPSPSGIYGKNLKVGCGVLLK